MIRIFSLENSVEWRSKVENLPLMQQDIYFLPEYYNIYENRGEGVAHCFVYENNEGVAIYPFMKREITRLSWLDGLEKKIYEIEGAYGYNGIVSSSESEDFKNRLFKEFGDYCQDSNIVAEFTRFHPVMNNVTFSEKELNIFLDRKTIYLDLEQSYNTVWSDYSRTNRNVIRKAQKIGVEIVFCVDSSYIKNFVKRYHRFLDFLQAGQYYYFGLQYFLDLQKYLNSHFHLFSAIYDSTIIAQLLLLTYKKYAHVHLACRDHRYFKIPANILLYDYGIKFSKELGCKFIHFGGGRSNSDDDSLFRFKRIFSNQESDFYIGKKVHNVDVYNNLCLKWRNRFRQKSEQYKSY